VFTIRSVSLECDFDLGLPVAVCWSRWPSDRTCYLRTSLRISKISLIRASRFWGGRSLGWMVCLSD
jgi:hypothetical protein